MTFLSLARSRRSVRTFDGKALTAEELQELVSFAVTVTTPYDIPISWCLLDTEKTGLSSPVIIGEKAYFTGKISRVPHAEEAFGYAFERVVLHAAEKGIGTTWIAGTMDRGAFERAVSLKEGEIMPCVSPLGRPAAKKSLREVMMRKGVSADSRLPFEKLFFLGDFSHPLSQAEAGKLSDVLEAVRLAPSACNYQPWRLIVTDSAVHFYLQRTKGFGAGRVFDTQKIDIGIALCHFALAMEEAGRGIRFTIADPGIALPERTVYIASYQLL